ncbi:hypothetical protein EVAR_62392_1 [Eumeta japonica]|uniref:Uncharacterized protein n=1 Tax=Eumeta variegata TaxID=151549 RepID=A0A4C1Z0X4_EUMVA|nr:hypothetical protein EVAR_62392_1 [Eumeta japonica]
MVDVAKRGTGGCSMDSSDWEASAPNISHPLSHRVLSRLIIARLTVDEKTVQRRWFPCMEPPTKNGTDLRLGVLALHIIARLTVDE